MCFSETHECIEVLFWSHENLFYVVWIYKEKPGKDFLYPQLSARERRHADRMRFSLRVQPKRANSSWIRYRALLFPQPHFRGNITSTGCIFRRNITRFHPLLSSQSFIMGEDGRISGPRTRVYISTLAVYTTRIAVRRIVQSYFEPTKRRLKQTCSGGLHLPALWRLCIYLLNLFRFPHAINGSILITLFIRSKCSLGRTPNPLMLVAATFLLLFKEGPGWELHEHSQLAAVSCMSNIPISPRQRIDRCSYLQPSIRDGILDFGDPRVL